MMMASINSSDFFLNDDLFNLSDTYNANNNNNNNNNNQNQNNKNTVSRVTLRLPIKASPPVVASNELHTPSIYIDSNPSEKNSSKFNWN